MFALSTTEEKNVKEMHQFILFTQLLSSPWGKVVKFTTLFMSSYCTDRRGGVEVERSPRLRKIKARSQVATDLHVCKSKKHVMTATLPNARQ